MEILVMVIWTVAVFILGYGFAIYEQDKGKKVKERIIEIPPSTISFTIFDGNEFERIEVPFEELKKTKYLELTGGLVAVDKGDSNETTN